MSETKTKVSVSMITYMHGKYIAEAIDSILNQNCEFDFELIIADDCSPDNTETVVRNIIKNHPKGNLIKYTRHIKNKGMLENFIWSFKQCDGQYIAICESDDYWTDPLKLQKQVELMEANKDVSLIFSNVKTILEGSETDSNYNTGFNEITKSRYFSASEILDNWTIPTPTVMFRKDTLKDNYFKMAVNKNFMFADIVLWEYLATKGKLLGTKDYFAVYRRHKGGFTNFNLDLNFYLKHYNHLKTLIKYFGSDLKTQKSKRVLADYALSLGLNKLSKGYIFSGLYYLSSSLKYNPEFLLKYLKNKIK